VFANLDTFNMKGSITIIVGAATKRLIDLLVSATLLLVASPLILVTAVAVRASLGGPVFFIQERPGRYGRIFRILKFRTMAELNCTDGRPRPDAERLGRTGRLLRAFSLDELPTLLNVLKGDMSLVGPRPLLVKYLELYTERQARRHEVRPGITGWAQVNGRNLVEWEGRLEMDVWYVDHRSFLLDLRILLLTVAKVLKREGISAEGAATMPEFPGSAPVRENQILRGE
jgi:sugar transferase EpsL